jgi:hypothetical protein
LSHHYTPNKLFISLSPTQPASELSFWMILLVAAQDLAKHEAWQLWYNHDKIYCLRDARGRGSDSERIDWQAIWVWFGYAQRYSVEGGGGVGVVSSVVGAASVAGSAAEVGAVSGAMGELAGASGHVADRTKVNAKLGSGPRGARIG